MTQPQPPFLKRHQTILICLGLVALTLAAYWPVWRFDFINYDDPDYVSENLRVQAGLSLDNLGWAFRTTFFENWHPLTWLSYMLDYQCFGLRPGAFHVVNVFFHGLNTLLLFAVFRRMTGARWPSAWVAALFALHPLHVESVAWVSERKDVLSGLFWLLTMWAYVRYTERPHVRRYFPVLLFFALGLMAKPMLVTLPFVLLLLDFWPLGRLQLESTPARSPAFRPTLAGGQSARPAPPKALLWLILEKAPLLILATVSSAVTYSAQHGAVITVTGLAVTKRLANALISYWRYVGKTFWPDSLAVYYPHPVQWPTWQVACAALALIAVTCLVARAARQRPYLAVGWLWYLGTMVPVIGLVQVGGQAMADRYMYLPLTGLLIMLAWGALELAERWHIGKTGVIPLSAATVAGCLLLSSLQLRFWRNSLTLFEHALAVTDRNTVAHNNLGDALVGLGRTNEAFVHFSQALEIEPEDSWARGNVGNILLAQGKIDDAIAQYQKGLQSDPHNARLNHNLGLSLARQGRFLESEPYYLAALHDRLDYADAYQNLGNALAAQGKSEAAISNYLALLRLRPDLAAAHFNLGKALTQQGRHKEAASQFLEVIRLQPDAAEARCELGLALGRQGESREALAQLTEALRLKPGKAEFHFHFATLLEMQKRSAEAAGQYQECLRLDPDSVLALNNLAWLLATHEDPALRNGQEAARCAERACQLTGRRQAFLMGTLAAAYAEAGRYLEAANTAQSAVELATADGQAAIAATNRKLIELYRAGRPYRDPATTRGKN